MNIKIEPKIFVSKSHLKRYWPENSRKMIYENAVKHLTSKKMDPKQFSIVIIQRFLHGSWTDQLYYVQKTATINTLYKKIIGNSKQSYFFFTPKKTQVMNNKTFQQIFQMNPTEENIIYLQLVSMDSFGWVGNIRN